MNWFTRTTGRAVQRAQDCECRTRGREGCFGCTRQPEYADKPPSTDVRVMYPRWWDKWATQRVNERDLDFLLGRTRQWRRA